MIALVIIPFITELNVANTSNFSIFVIFGLLKLTGHPPSFGGCLKK
jgi:hypothetical protein